MHLVQVTRARRRLHGGHLGLRIAQQLLSNVGQAVGSRPVQGSAQRVVPAGTAWGRLWLRGTARPSCRTCPTGVSSSLHGAPGRSAALEGCRKKALLSAKLEGMKAHARLQLQTMVHAGQAAACSVHMFACHWSRRTPDQADPMGNRADADITVWCKAQAASPPAVCQGPMLQQQRHGLCRKSSSVRHLPLSNGNVQ